MKNSYKNPLYLVVIWFRNAMGRTICHTVHTYFFPKHQYIMNLSPTDQLFSHIVGHTEKLLCRGVRFVLLCCDIPDLLHSPIETRTKERKKQWVEVLYDGNFLSLQKKIVPLFIFMKMCMQVRKLLCLQFYQKSNEKMSLAYNKWSNQKNNGNFH